MISWGESIFIPGWGDRVTGRDPAKYLTINDCPPINIIDVHYTKLVHACVTFYYLSKYCNILTKTLQRND